MDKRNFMGRRSVCRNYRQVAHFVNTVRLHDAKKKAPKRGLFPGGCKDQSLLPPPMPSSISKLWKTLNALKYRESVAVM